MKKKLSCAIFAFLPACLAAVSLTVHGQVFPERPIRMVVGFPAGGATDILARLVATPMGESLKQPVIVENKPGASGVISHEFVAKAAPDGYTLIITNQADAVNSSLLPKLPYNLTRDFQPISGLNNTAYILVVTPALKVKTIGELIAFAKKNPGTLTYATSGIGTGSHMASELLNKVAGIRTSHIPYKGTAPAANDLVGGHVSMSFLSSSVSLPLIKDRRVIALGVSTASRMTGAPDIPPLAEQGLPGFDVGSWNAMQAPAGISRQLLNRLATEVHRALELPDVKAKLVSMGTEVTPSSPEATEAFLKADIARWADIIKVAGIKPE